MNMKHTRITLLILSLLLIMTGCKDNTASLTTTKDSITTTTQEPITTTEEVVTTTQEIVTTTEHIHTFGEWTTINNPSCTNKGLKERVCSCGEKETQEIEALGHDYSKWVTINEPTDINNGKRERTCSRCGHKEEEIIDSLSYIDQLVFELSEDESYYIVSGKKNYSYDTIVIPSVYNNKSVKEIKNEGFKYINNLKSVYISPYGITSIGSEAFYGCSSLESIIIPNSVTSIGKYAFASCSSLTSITIPNSVTSIGYGAFSYCYKLVEVINKSDLKLTIGSNDNGHIARYAKSIVDDESKSRLSRTEDGFVLCTIDDEVILVSYLGDSENVVIPFGVTTIGIYAFYRCLFLSSVVIPNGVTSIGDQAFKACESLTLINIPDGVISIKNRTFESCESLTSITIPDSVTYVGFAAFENCPSLMSVSIGKNVTLIDGSAFYNCFKLVEVINKSNLELTIGSNENGSIAYYAKSIVDDESKSKLSKTEDGFVLCTIDDEVILVSYLGDSENVVIPFGVMSIGIYAFNRCLFLSSVVIPDSVTSISSYAFHDCISLTSITIPDSVTSIGECAFIGCESLISVVLPNGLLKIEDYLFAGCSSLTSITIPDSVISIGNYVSRYCYRLAEIINKSDIELTIGSNENGSIAYYAKSVVDDESKSRVSKTDDGFILCTIDDEVILVSYLGDSENVVIPSNVTTIGNGAFYGCSNIQSIELTNHVTLIRENALYGCSSLASIKMSNSMQKIESNAIMKCEYLKTIQYNGTMDEWNLIDRELNSINTAIVGVNIEYYDSLQGCTIICTDGMIVY